MRPPYLLLKGRYIPVEGGLTPERATLAAAAFDCFARTGGTIQPGQRALVPLGFKLLVLSSKVIESDNDLMLDSEQLDHSDIYEFELRPRSGLANKAGVTLLNAPGTIDADYTDEVGAILINHGNLPFAWKAGDRVCQAIWPHVMSWNKPHEGLRVKITPRTGGFGSTGTGGV